MIPATEGVLRLPEMSCSSAHRTDKRCYNLTDKVEIQHSLACFRLETVDERSRLGME
jgi:hypothetical protein